MDIPAPTTSNPSPSPTQPDHQPVFTEFRQWLDRSLNETRHTQKLRNVEKEAPGFVPKSNICRVAHGSRQHYLTTARIATFLQELFPGGSEVDAHEVETHCPIGFCILIHIRRGHYILELVRNAAFRDQHLPLATQPEPKIFPDDIWIAFQEAQWQFFQCEMKANFWETYPEQYILPWISKRLVATGATSEVYEVTLHRDYDGLVTPAQSNPNAHRRYALKTYKGQYARRNFDNETRNFRRLWSVDKSSPPGIIEYFGAYRHGSECNILLEYAEDGTLDDFLRHEPPPTDCNDILRLWTTMLKLLQALVRIHEVLQKKERFNESGEETTSTTRYQGAHQDIAPQNIVLVRMPGSIPQASVKALRCDFKLADLGLGQFVAAEQGTNARIPDLRGGRNFSAPETYASNDFDNRSRNHVTPAADIFSLGCVYLTVAVWVVHGPAGVETFEADRKEENERAGAEADFRFHNGKFEHSTLLRCVERRLDYLSNNMRSNDYITGKVLELVKQMLYIDPGARPSAQNRWHTAQLYLQKAEQELQRSSSSSGSISVSSPRTPNHHESVTGRRSQHSRQPTSGSSRYVQILDPLEEPKFGPVLTKSPSGTMDDFQAFPSGDHAALAQNSSLRTGTTTTYRTAESTPTMPPPPPPTHVSIMTQPRIQHYAAQPDELRARLRGLHLGDGPGNHQDTASRLSSPSQRHGNMNGSYSPQSQAGPSTPISPSRNLTVKKPGTATITHQTVAEILQWKWNRKKGLFGLGKHKKANELPNLAYNMKFIKNRDHIFLIADWSTMKNYWDHVGNTFEALSYLVKKCDEDGIEVLFASSNTVQRDTTTSKLVESVRQRQPQAETNIQARLSFILQRLAERLRNNAATGRRDAVPASIYILSDGLWDESQDLLTPIYNIINTLQSGHYERKQIGISLISFGNNSLGLRRLKEMDDAGKAPHIGMDIVDTEHHLGNVWKMLIGPIDETFDEEGHE